MKYALKIIVAMGTATLVETLNATHQPGVSYKPVTADTARRWVKDGGLHETGLYVDHEGRVRYAESLPC